MYQAMSSGAAPHGGGAAQPRTGSDEFAFSRGGLKRDSFDLEYVRRLKDGDPETERHFVAYFCELLLIKLRSRLRDSQLIEDLRQETLLRVLTALKAKNCLQSPERLGSYVNSVCNNLLFEMYRRNSRQQPVEMDDQFDAPDHRASVETEMVTEERRQQVRRVLAELPAKDRQVLRMVFYEGIDRDEICRCLHVEREYLRVLVHRAKARFRECLMKHGSGGTQANMGQAQA